MLGNPYSSNDSDLGPLMREIKNKICRDCELVALLEDDNGMELLVNNKIISLDLPVSDVYDKVWFPDAVQKGEPMRIIYRMRGLLGEFKCHFQICSPIPMNCPPCKTKAKPLRRAVMMS